MQHYHQGFGFYLQSQWPLPLPSCESNANFDAIFCTGDVPAILESASDIGKRLQVTSSEILLSVDDIGIYHCHQDGITVSPISSDDDDISTFLIYAALPYWLMLKGCLVFRGCAFTTDEQHAHLLLSQSGTGSSTLFATASKHGAQLISDHLCVLKIIDDQACIMPGFNQVKLWEKPLTAIFSSTKHATKLRHNIHQYTQPVVHLNQALPISSIFALKSRNKDDSHIEPVKGINNIKLKIAYAFCHQAYKPMSFHKDHHLIWMKALQQARIHNYIITHGVQTPTEVLQDLSLMTIEALTDVE